MTKFTSPSLVAHILFLNIDFLESFIVNIDPWIILVD
jgi:hypothetical protein